MVSVLSTKSPFLWENNVLNRINSLLAILVLTNALNLWNLARLLIHVSVLKGINTITIKPNVFPFVKTASITAKRPRNALVTGKNY